jgi:hypothetical protein
MKISPSISAAIAVGLVILAVVIAVGLQQASIDRKILVRAVTQQLDGHSPSIVTMLSTMSNSDTSLIEDAAYRELQTAPSTSLILRSDIKVMAAHDGLLQCMIDTSRFGLPPRVIHQSTSRDSTP